MKLLFALHGFLPEMCGGTERYVLSAANGLVARGHDVVVLAGTLEGRSPAQVSEASYEGLRVLRVHRDDAFFERWDRRMHAGVRQLVREILAREEPDVFHVNHWFRLSFDLVREGCSAGIATLLTVHDSWATCPTLHRVLPDGRHCSEPAGPACLECVGDDEDPRSLEDLIRHAMAEIDAADRVFALSEAHARLLALVTNQPRETFEVLPFRGLHSLATAPAPDAALPMRIVNWGTQAFHKGIHVLLEAVGLMRNSNRVELHLFGGCFDGEYDARLAALAEGLPVTRHGAFEHGALERGPFHVAVFPSICAETYGFALDEAQELGLPAIVTDSGAYRERVGEGGQTFPRGDARALARLLDGLVEDPARLRELRGRVPKPRPFREHLDFLERAYVAAAAPPDEEGAS